MSARARGAQVLRGPVGVLSLAANLRATGGVFSRRCRADKACTSLRAALGSASWLRRRRESDGVRDEHEWRAAARATGRPHFGGGFCHSITQGKVVRFNQDPEARLPSVPEQGRRRGQVPGLALTLTR